MSVELGDHNGSDVNGLVEGSCLIMHRLTLGSIQNKYNVIRLNRLPRSDGWVGGGRAVVGGGRVVVGGGGRWAVVGRGWWVVVFVAAVGKLVCVCHS